MCKEAKEIQKTWNPQEGDCFKAHWYDEGNPSGILIVIDDFEVGLNADKEKDIWLPRQNQLQNFLIPDYFDCSVGVMLGLMQEWEKEDNKNYNNKYLSLFTDIECLLLVFVMKIKYNKLWNNNKNRWEKI